MNIQIHDKSLIQAVQYLATSLLIFNVDDIPAPRAIALRDILLYPKYVQVGCQLDTTTYTTTYTIYLVTQPNKQASYLVIKISPYKIHAIPYPSHLKPLVTYILNYVKNFIVNSFTSKLTTAINTTINNNHNRKLVNKLPNIH